MERRWLNCEEDEGNESLQKCKMEYPSSHREKNDPAIKLGRLFEVRSNSEICSARRFSRQTSISLLERRAPNNPPESWPDQNPARDLLTFGSGGPNSHIGDSFRFEENISPSVMFVPAPTVKLHEWAGMLTFCLCSPRGRAEEVAFPSGTPSEPRPESIQFRQIRFEIVVIPGSWPEL